MITVHSPISLLNSRRNQGGRTRHGRTIRNEAAVEMGLPSPNGTPLNPGNALNRHVRPAAEELMISLGGGGTIFVTRYTN